MLIHDRVYGDFEVNEQVLLELINSKPIQRLKKIRQHGAASLVYPEITSITRFEHSVGVMLLLRKLRASLEEQTAGLLHDVSHTAFSHTIDFVFKEGKNPHEFHERFKERVVLNSKIPQILEKNDLDVRRILDDKLFGLLEKPIPNLCADRLDYFLRDAKTFRIEPGISEKINFLLQHLVVKDNEIIADSFDTAKQMAELYLKCSKNIWSDIIHIALYRILADAFRIAMDKNLISESDLFLTDDELFEKLKKSNDSEVNEKLKLLSKSFNFKNDRKSYDFIAYPKPRYIDPKFIADRKIGRVSEVDKEFKYKLERFIKEKSDGYYIRVMAK